VYEREVLDLPWSGIHHVTFTVRCRMFKAEKGRVPSRRGSASVLRGSWTSL